MEPIELLVLGLVTIPIILYLRTLIERVIRSPMCEDFPPITDEKFLARCKPGTDPEIALKVRAIVADQLCIEEARICPEHRFIEDLRAD